MGHGTGATHGARIAAAAAIAGLAAAPGQASEPLGRYDCTVGATYFSIDLMAGGACRTQSISAQPASCAYHLAGSGVIEFDSTDRPELRAFIVRYVPPGATVGTRKGPALQLRNERTLDDPPPTVGWCARRG